jgi:hypothetical protein
MTRGVQIILGLAALAGFVLIVCYNLYDLWKGER